MVDNNICSWIAQSLDHCRQCRDDEESLFRATINLTASLLLISFYVSVLRQDAEPASAEWLHLYTIIDLLLSDFEERLNTLQRAGNRVLGSPGAGRPRVEVNIPQVERLVELGIPLTSISSTLGISRTTLWRRLSKLGLCVQRFTTIDDSTLDSIIEGLVNRFPNAGIEMITGYLRSANIFLTRSRIRNSLVRVSPAGMILRQLTTTVRRVYSVPAPNSLWHIDGLHCLIRWRLVIHGGVDGFSRLIVYLKCSENNRADTVLELFLHAVRHYGWPSHVRSDLGMENIEVARAMITNRGTGREAISVELAFTINELRDFGVTHLPVWVTCITLSSMIWKSTVYSTLLMIETSFVYTLSSFLALISSFENLSMHGIIIR